MIKRGVRFVGFDLDGTLYRSTPEMNDRVRDKIAERILEKMPQLGSVKSAREEFERRYCEVESGTRVLSSFGYENPREVMEDCLVTADITDLIPEDPTLIRILEQIRDNYDSLYLITSSPREIARKKLKKIGIGNNLFEYYLFGDDGFRKSKGDAFKEIFRTIGYGKPENHIYIGDKANSDIIPARDLGMRTVAVWSDIPEADISLKSIYGITGVLLNE